MRGDIGEGVRVVGGEEGGRENREGALHLISPLGDTASEVATNRYLHCTEVEPL